MTGSVRRGRGGRGMTGSVTRGGGGRGMTGSVRRGRGGRGMTGSVRHGFGGRGMTGSVRRGRGGPGIRFPPVSALKAADAGGDFDLGDALGDPTKKPPPKGPTAPKKPASDDLNLDDALPGGGISDRDLEDVAGSGGRGGGGRSEEPEPEGSPQGLVPGVVAAVVAAVAGAVSSFVAYQKKRLCFREPDSAPV
uniref:CD99 antigen-like isoform X3 n=1 Tax=Arvicanthis niloticus TaxID=61156 RepID=UPI0014862544|nr:CD99 antigen-like isoform X3 [Arvicanthis niloticus]